MCIMSVTERGGEGEGGAEEGGGQGRDSRSKIISFEKLKHG